MIKIKSNDNGSTSVYNEAGQEITGVMSIDVQMDPLKTTATMEVMCDSLDDVDNIHALLGTETLEQVAKLHGKKLYDEKSSGLATIDLKFDCSKIESVKSIIDLIAKYSEQLPVEMQKELSELA